MFRRIFLVLLMLALPFQASWSVAAGFCQHEQGKAASHFGHHDHKNHDATNGDATDKYSSQVDRDCGYHHQESPHWLPTLNQTPDSFTESQNLNPDIQLLLSEAIVERPERPNWLLAA